MPVASEIRATMDISCGAPWGGSGLTKDYAGVLQGTLIIPVSDEYTLTAWTDWGYARLIVNGIPVAAKNWWGGTPLEATLALEAGPATIELEICKSGDYGCTYAQLSWSSDLITEQLVPASAWATPGVHVNYYDVAGQFTALPTDVPDFDNYVIYYSDGAPNIDYPWNVPAGFMGVLGGDTGVRFDGYISVPRDGDYTFYLAVDEGGKVFVDGALVAYLNNPGGNTPSSTIYLTKGVHAFRVDAYERGYFYVLQAWIAGPGITKQIIPPSMFTHGDLSPAFCLGDVNCDGSVTFADIDPFVARLGCPNSNPAACSTGCTWQNADIDGDTAVTFADIDPFVARLGHACP